MSNISRRDLLKTALAGGAVASLPTSAFAAKRSATDLVNLGNSGVKVSRLALGCGSNGGRVQRELGQEGFNKLVRYAYDHGIRFFETADSYRTHELLATALKGIPRDSYKLMTKYRLRETETVQATIDRFRKELNTDYFDILLLHCVRTHDWPEQFAKLRDEFSAAKDKKIIVAHGASCHGLLPLRQFPNNKWLDVALMRVNHDGTKMDGMHTTDTNDKGDVNEVVSHLKTIHKQGTGVIGMKLIGEGRFNTAEERRKSFNFVMKLGTVDAVTVGFKSPAEIDEAIENINAGLNA